MRFILLSGGSGRRLWPISNDSRAKQFLKLLANENGRLESMVQRVWRQLNDLGMNESAIIATGRIQEDIITNQLGENVKLIIEPERRDTYPAIVLAAAYLFSVEKAGLDEVVVVLPVDSFVEKSFLEQVKELESALVEANADIALVGVTPTYPSEKFGYIIPEPINYGQSFFRVNRFQEKPTRSQACELITRHALWNCGVFAFKLGYIISKLEQAGLPKNYQELKEQYSSLPAISFDYEVIEKAENIIAVGYSGVWKDLGTWNSLTEEIASSVIGQGLLSGGSVDTHIINELNVPLVALGLTNTIIAASQDGILVADKDLSPIVKEVVEELRLRPMYEERRWGWYKVIDYTKFDNDQEVLTKRIKIAAGKNISYQMHYKRSEVWTIVYGEGELALNDVMYKVKPGDVLHIPAGDKHAVKADTDLELIEIQTGTDLNEDDIVRICLTWNEVQNRCETSKYKKMRREMG